MTSATKNVWLVIFDNVDKQYSNTSTYRYAAYDLVDLLSYFNAEGQKRILKIEKLNETITYRY